MAVGRPKNSREVTPRLRWALDKAIDILEKRSGLDLAEHLADEMQDRGVVTVIREMSCILPKNVEMDVKGSVAIDTKASAEDLQIIRNLRQEREVNATH